MKPTFNYYRKDKTEKQIQDEIIAKLARLGYTVLRLNSGVFKNVDRYGTIKSYFRAYILYFAKIFVRGGKSSSGAPDVMIFKDGKTIFIECKTQSGKQTDSQKQFQKEIEAQGFKYILARSINDIIDL